MAQYQEFQEIIHGSKQFDFSGPILTIQGYYTGKTVKLDLSQIDEEMLKALLVEEDPDDEDYCYDYDDED